MSSILPKLSIIIPVLNEAKNIAVVLTSLTVAENIEIIVVDGGSQDETKQIAQSFPVKVIHSSPGRANQMNAGAAIARGKILLFLHADTLLPQNFLQLINQALSQPQTVAGAFELAIAGESKSLRFIATLVNWRTHFLSLPYGDQAIFLSAVTFKRIQGYENIPIMEDFTLIKKLQKLGKIAIISSPVITSNRRWQKLGVLKTTLINQLIILGYYLGVSPEKLSKFYRRR